MVSARVPSHFNWPLLHIVSRLLHCWSLFVVLNGSVSTFYVTSYWLVHTKQIGINHLYHEGHRILKIQLLHLSDTLLRHYKDLMLTL